MSAEPYRPRRWCQFDSGVEPCKPEKNGPCWWYVDEDLDRKKQAEHTRDRHRTAWFFIKHGGVVPM